VIAVLQAWGILDEEVAGIYRDLEDLRHSAVHFDPKLTAAGRESALAALLALQGIVEHVFEPHGGPPRYIANTDGAS
jgi:NCAIR mutase (PurE)-related protein